MSLKLAFVFCLTPWIGIARVAMLALALVLLSECHPTKSTLQPAAALRQLGME